MIYNLKSFTAFLFCCLAFPVAADDSVSILDDDSKDTLVIGILEDEGVFAHWNFITHQYDGFAVDVAKELCNDRRRNCIVASGNADSIEQMLVDGRVDFAMASVGDVLAKSHKLTYSEPYYSAHPVFFTKDSSYYSIGSGDLADKSVGAKIGTVIFSKLAELLKKDELAELKAYSSNRAMFDDLQAGYLDFICLDSVSGFDSMKQLSEYSNVAEFYAVNQDGFMGLNNVYARVVVRADKRAKANLKAINNALNELKSKGTYQALEMKYFPFIHF